MITVDAENVPESLVNGPELPEDQVMYIEEEHDGVDFLVEIEDFFGSDYIVKIPTGQLVLTDRNCGFHSIVDERSFNEFMKEQTS